ncbi:tyrosine-type recombinase/integrase [Clostridioides difficile]|uniref:tyrosine-type recombinase/integrase n=1 Tax=Clostridioides sp. GD02404 TaxID=3054354 RepID=UPI00389D1823
METIVISRDISIKLKTLKANQNEFKLISSGLYKDSNYVFCNELGELFNENKPNKILTTILNKSWIDPIKFHALRYTYSTRLFEAKILPKTTQPYLATLI